MLTKFTPEEAQTWIDLYTGAKDMGIMRRINPEWVAFLAEEMRRGHFEPTALIALAQHNGHAAIVNGNHTLRAIVASGVTLDLPIETYRVETAQEVRDLYAAFDIGRKRIRSDSFRAYDALTVLGIAGITPADVNALASAVQFIAQDFDIQKGHKHKMGSRDLLALMRPWAASYGALLGIVGKRDYKEWYSRVAKRRAVCAVALFTMRYQPERAARFWSSIALGNVTPKSPTLRLRDYLLTTNVMGGGKTANQQENVTRMARVVAYYWNKYYEGKQVGALRVDEKAPVLILGTPLDTERNRTAWREEHMMK